jgi:hypothetical protein
LNSLDYLFNKNFTDWVDSLGQYEDDTAAEIGGLVTGDWYYNTTLKTITQL